MRAGFTRWRMTGGLTPAVLLVASLAGTPAFCAGRHLSRGVRDDVKYTCVVLEDAEDGNMQDWDIYDPTPPGEVLSEPDPSNQKNHVVVLKPEGSSWDTGFRFSLPEGQGEHSILQWRMNFRGKFTIYVNCDTTAGNMYVNYLAQDKPTSFDGTRYVTHFLGEDTGIGRWTTVRRDIQADLWAGDRTIKLLAIRAIMVRGDGMLDDIRLYDYPDEDHDLLPDDFEIRRKLDPKDPADATARLVEQVVKLTDSPDGKAREVVIDEDQTEKEQPLPKNESVWDKAKRLHLSLDNAEREQLQAYFRERVATYLSAAPKPQIGRTYRVPMKTGNVVDGKLEEFGTERIVLQTVHGRLYVSVRSVNCVGCPALFPQGKARQLATDDTQKRAMNLMAAKVARAENDVGNPDAKDDLPTREEANALFGAPTEPAAPVDVSEQEVQEVTPVVADNGDEGAPTVEKAGDQEPVARLVQKAKPVYDATLAPTPDGLKPVLAAFGDWLKMQHRRVGGRIAGKIYAKEQQGNAVLYLVMDPAFLKQGQDLRQRTAVGIEKFWAFRCQAMGVADLPNSHVVFVSPDGRIVGGSRPDDAAAVWVKK